jgi:DNA modification methylase
MSGQLGLESTPDAYVAAMVDVFREVRRVLADDGTLWLNLGDSYAANMKGSGGVGKGTLNCGPELNAWSTEKQMLGDIRTFDLQASGLKQKDLVGIPWMMAFALRADGWYLRSDIIWSKPNPMPESVTDRPTKAHEYIFLLSKSRSYFYDAAAIRETQSDATIQRWGDRAAVRINPRSSAPDRNDFTVAGGENSMGCHPDGRNKRSVWAIATQPYPDAHFATYPEKLIEPCILAGSALGDTVLDPFTGSGTTGAVSVRHQRNFIGCELNPAYVALARTRIGDVAPMFTEEVA